MPIRLPKWCVCCLVCFSGHASKCKHASLSHHKVLILSAQDESALTWGLVTRGLVVEFDFPKKVRRPDAGIVICLPYFPPWGNGKDTRINPSPSSVKGSHKQRSKARWENKLMFSLLDSFSTQVAEGRLAFLLQRADSQCWNLREMKNLLRTIDVEVCTFSSGLGNSKFVWKLVHNSPPRLCNILKTVDFSKGGSDLSNPKLIEVLCLVFKAAMGKWTIKQFPVGSFEQQRWVLQSLQHSTKALSRPGVAALVCDSVQKILSSMYSGGEIQHLHFILQNVDFRGSEVSLRDSTVLEGGRQTIPYPAPAWEWKCVQTYAWQQPQHINVLELLAYFNYLRMYVMKPRNHSHRFLHVFDSRVCSCVVAKGRSSSF